MRELESAIGRAVASARGGLIEAADLGLTGVPAGAPPTTGSAFAGEGLCSYKIQKRRILEAFERQYLIHLMTEYRGNVSRAARAAGKERRDLGKLLKRHGFEARQFSPAADALASAGAHIAV